MSLPILGLDGLIQIQEMNDRNLVYFYQAELRAIDRGYKVDLTRAERHRFRIRGLLAYLHTGRWALTARCKAILASL